MYRKGLKIGLAKMVPISEAQVLIEALHEKHGLLPRHISMITDISDCTLYAIRSGRYKEVRKVIVAELAKLMEREYFETIDCERGPQPLRREMQSVRLNGYTYEDVSVEAGYDPRFARKALCYNKKLSPESYRRLEAAIKKVKERPFRENCLSARRIRSRVFDEIDALEESA